MEESKLKEIAKQFCLSNFNTIEVFCSCSFETQTSILSELDLTNYPSKELNETFFLMVEKVWEEIRNDR